jgi:hypothetical protein
MFFTYRVNIKNQKNIVTEKGDKKFLLFFLSIIFLSLFYGEETKPREMTKSRKGSQTGAGQGREACRVGGESTAVFPSPLMLPPYYR